MTFPDRKALVFAALCGAAMWMPEAQALCFGLGASASGCDTIDGSCGGTTDRDVITCVNPAGCVMDGGARGDLLFGGPGPDLICAGSGNDAVQGGAGSDLIRGDSGDDLVIGDSSFFVETDLFESCDGELVFTCGDILTPTGEEILPPSGDILREILREILTP